MKTKLNPRSVTTPGHFTTPERRLAPTLMALSILLGCTLTAVHAQNYAIDWSTIAGGGTSTGGVYSVTATIGQPDAGAISNGNYTLAGGFWSIIAAVQTTHPPLLSISRTSTNTVPSCPQFNELNAAAVITRAETVK